MQRIKTLLIPAAALVSLVIVINLTHILPGHWRGIAFILGALAGLVPLALDIVQSLRQGKINLGVPVLATIVILLFVRQYLIADVFALLIIVGNIFKEYILWRVELSVKEVSHSLPQIAFVKGNEVREVQIKDIKYGDVVVVKAGGRVPVDGVLLTEEAILDESVITGESKMITKGQGAHVVAGSINQGSSFDMQAKSTSASSTLAQIDKLVEEAQRHSSSLSRFTDRFAMINAGAALIGTFVIYLVTKNIMQALAFWIALVPVVFAIIVPVATTIGISILAKKGIMVKSGEALENMTRINSMVFDKTGTLTKGSPEISKVVMVNDKLDERKLIELAASVEKYSEHPLAKAFLRKAEALQAKILPVTHVQIMKGKGLQGVCEGNIVLIGSAHLVGDMGISVTPEMENLMKENENEGKAPIFVAVDGNPAGIVFLSDELRDHIEETMDRFRKMGMKLTMITGDNKVVAERVAKVLGLTRYFAETLPQDKIKYIREFKARGERVAMIGDGINDAPAISESNVGIAMGLKGTDITLNSSKVVLVNDNLEVLPYALTLSKNVLRIIRWNLYLATSIHVIAAVLSVTGVITVLGSALIHQISSVAVLLNTLRLYSLKK